MTTTDWKKDNKGRKSPPREKGDLLICGIHPVAEALESGKELEKIMIRAGSSGSQLSEILQKARSRGIPVQQVPPEKLDGLVRTNHQGIVAVISAIAYLDPQVAIPELLEKNPRACFIVLDGITDVRNFGAIARSAVCFGAAAIVVQGKGSAQANAEAVKASAGALHHIPVLRTDSLLKTITQMKELEITVIGLTEKAGQTLDDTKTSFPIALVLGSEGAGLSAQVLRWADILVKIPQNATIASLNVSNAAAIALYHFSKPNP